MRHMCRSVVALHRPPFSPSAPPSDVTESPVIRPRRDPQPSAVGEASPASSAGVEAAAAAAEVPAANAGEPTAVDCRRAELYGDSFAAETRFPPRSARRKTQFPPGLM